MTQQESSPLTLTPIGRVRSAYASRAEAPKQGAEAAAQAVIELDPAWREGLTGLEPGRWLWVIYHFDRADAPRTLVHPRGDASRPVTGLFNTRSPSRPNPLALSLVRLVALEGARLSVRGLEALDGTPVLDIKPYVPAVDQPRKDADG